MIHEVPTFITQVIFDKNGFNTKKSLMRYIPIPTTYSDFFQTIQKKNKN